MKVHIYSVKAKSQAANKSQIYNDNTKRPKPKEDQLRILGISSREFTNYVGNSAEERQRDSAAGAMYLSLKIFV